MFNMKKLLSVLIAAVMSVTMLFGTAAVQAENDIKVLLDGKEIAFDVPPQIFEDFTFVPMRAIFEALGATVEWDGEARSITSTKDDTKIFMVIDLGGMLVNGEFIELEAPPRIVDDRTLVPVRAVAESFDCEVGWDGNTRTVTITTKAEPAQPKEVYNIEYDNSAEVNSSTAKNFKITDITKNSDGDYEINYTVQTYQDGSGFITVMFDCYDAQDKRIDGFAGMFYTWAYSWTEQTGVAVISGKTVKIKLAENIFSN